MLPSADMTFEVLLVEDEPAIRELVRSLLTAEGVSVTVAVNGAEGLRIARSRRFDLVLLDVQLPQLDGVSVCRMLRVDPASAKVPVYMLTAGTRPSDREAALRAGASGYIEKPFRGNELVGLVKRLRAFVAAKG